MSRSLPPLVLNGIGEDLLFDRGALGAAVWGAPRSQGWDEAEMSGVLSVLKKVGGAAVSVTKAVGKGVVNAAASRVGLGPVFSANQTASIVPGQQAIVSGGAQQPTNYMPWIIGGGAALALVTVVVLATRK